jgi:hypothetical protein
MTIAENVRCPFNCQCSTFLHLLEAPIFLDTIAQANVYDALQRMIYEMNTIALDQQLASRLVKTTVLCCVVLRGCL